MATDTLLLDGAEGMPAATPASPKTIKCPFTIAIDTREQLPYTFTEIYSDADRGRALIEVPTIRTGLPHGDYTILGLPQMVVERKSKEDLYSSISQRRDNFERRLALMQEELRWACVIIEADWRDLLASPPAFSEFSPKSLNRTLIAWEQRFPRVHWRYAHSRVFAEQLTFRMLERWWRDHKDDANIATL
jgi:ERCC4-type nuclease